MCPKLEKLEPAVKWLRSIKSVQVSITSQANERCLKVVLRSTLLPLKTFDDKKFVFCCLKTRQISPKLTPNIPETFSKCDKNVIFHFRKKSFFYCFKIFAKNYELK